MPENKNDNVVVAIFPSREAAESALDQLRNWDKADASVKLGNMGIITKEDGKVKTRIPGNWGIGGLFKKDLNLTQETTEMLGEHLDEGGAALAVTLDEAEIQAVTDQLISYGGKVRTYILPTADLQAVSEAAKAEAVVENVEVEIGTQSANAATPDQPAA